MQPSALPALSSFVSTLEHNVHDLWTQWATISTRQHLLLSCYILDSQQTTLFARDPESSPRFPVDDLPFPVQQSLWDAKSANEWFALVQQPSTMPRTIFEAFNHPIVGGYEDFQAVVLIATYYARFSGDASCFDTDIDHLLAKSPKIRHQVLTAKLVRLVPVRALLAVSGETWVLGTKATSQSECTALRGTLHTWLGQLWSCPVHDHLSTTVEALRISIVILHLSFTTPELLALGVDHKLGLFIASLVVWAATVATGTRANGSGTPAQHSHLSPVTKLPVILATPAYPSSFTSVGQAPELYQDIQAALALPAPFDGRSSMPHSDVASNTSHFLVNAIKDIASLNVIPCHTGCTSLLLWLKMHLRGASLHERNSPAQDVVLMGDYDGELVSIILGQIERMLSQGWEVWGI